MNPDQPPGPPGRRSLLVRIGLLAVLLVAAGVAIANLIPGSGRRLDYLQGDWLAVAIAAEGVACSAYAALFRGVFSADHWRVGRWRSTQIALGELAAFVVVPTGVGGPALRVWALLRGGMPLRTIVSRSVVHAALLNVPFAAAAAVLGLTVVAGLGPGRAPTLVALAPLALVIAAVAGALALARYLRTHGPSSRWGWRRFTHEAAAALPDGLRRIPDALRSPRLVLSGVAYWAGDCGVLVLAFAALHGSAPLDVVILAYMLGQLGNALPLPGGIGGVEPLMLGVLGSSGIDLGLGGAAVLLYRIISLGLQTALGTAAVITLLPAVTASDEEPIEPPAGEGEPETPSAARVARP